MIEHRRIKTLEGSRTQVRASLESKTVVRKHKVLIKQDLFKIDKSLRPGQL
jgi:hypothetical protein